MKSASREKKQETGCGKKGRHVWRRLSYAALIALYFTSFALLCSALLCFVLVCFVLFCFTLFCYCSVLFWLVLKTTAVCKLTQRCVLKKKKKNEQQLGRKINIGTKSY